MTIPIKQGLCFEEAIRTYYDLSHEKKCLIVPNKGGKYSIFKKPSKLKYIVLSILGRMPYSMKKARRNLLQNIKEQLSEGSLDLQDVNLRRALNTLMGKLGVPVIYVDVHQKGESSTPVKREDWVDLPTNRDNLETKMIVVSNSEGVNKTGKALANLGEDKGVLRKTLERVFLVKQVQGIASFGKRLSTLMRGQIIDDFIKTNINNDEAEAVRSGDSDVQDAVTSAVKFNLNRIDKASKENKKFLDSMSSSSGERVKAKYLKETLSYTKAGLLYPDSLKEKMTREEESVYCKNLVALHRDIHKHSVLATCFVLSDLSKASGLKPEVKIKGPQEGFNRLSISNLIESHFMFLINEGKQPTKVTSLSITRTARSLILAVEDRNDLFNKTTSVSKVFLASKDESTFDILAGYGTYSDVYRIVQNDQAKDICKKFPFFSDIEFMKIAYTRGIDLSPLENLLNSNEELPEKLLDDITMLMQELNLARDENSLIWTSMKGNHGIPYGVAEQALASRSSMIHEYSRKHMKYPVKFSRGIQEELYKETELIRKELTDDLKLSRGRHFQTLALLRISSSIYQYDIVDGKEEVLISKFSTLLNSNSEPIEGFLSRISIRETSYCGINATFVEDQNEVPLLPERSIARIHF